RRIAAPPPAHGRDRQGAPPREAPPASGSRPAGAAPAHGCGDGADVTAEAGKSAAVSAFRGFGTALPEHTIDGAQSLALLADFWPRLRGATPEPVTRHLVAPADWLMQPRSLGETLRLYGAHAPPPSRLPSCQSRV